MVTKLKLKSLFADNVKKMKMVEKSNPEMNLYGVLFELSCCHNISLEEMQKTLAKVLDSYMDFNEFRVTEVDDICAEFNMPDRMEPILTFIECLDDVFEKNGTIDLAQISTYDETKIAALFSRLSGNISGSCYSYYLNRLGKEGVYAFSDNQVRILKRLKIVGEEDEFDDIKKKVEKVYPAEKGNSFFLACQIHANDYCREDNPSCTRCPFLSECDFGKEIVAERETKEKERELVRIKALEEEQKKIDNEKKKVKPSKKKDKNGEKENAENDSDGNSVGTAEPELSKKEKKKLLALQAATEKAERKAAEKLQKIKDAEDKKLLAQTERLAAAALKKAASSKKVSAPVVPPVDPVQADSLPKKKGGKGIPPVTIIASAPIETPVNKKKSSKTVASSDNVVEKIVVPEISTTPKKLSKKQEAELAKAKEESKVSAPIVVDTKKESKKLKGKVDAVLLPDDVKSKNSSAKPNKGIVVIPALPATSVKSKGVQAKLDKNKASVPVDKVSSKEKANVKNIKPDGSKKVPLVAVKAIKNTKPIKPVSKKTPIEKKVDLKKTPTKEKKVEKKTPVKAKVEIKKPILKNKKPVKAVVEKAVSKKVVPKKVETKKKK
jgi:hypothetical protein